LSLTDDAGVISGHADNCVRYWDAKTGDCIKEISGIHAGSISSISISPDVFQILTSSRDNTLKIIDIRTFKVFQTFSDPSFKIPFDYSRACYSSDGRLIAAGSSDGKVFVWNSASGQLEKQFDCER
jgi:autophagy-related protein 16